MYGDGESYKWSNPKIELCILKQIKTKLLSFLRLSSIFFFMCLVKIFITNMVCWFFQGVNHY